MPITMLYAGALALVFLVLSYRVIQGRHVTGVNLGDGGNETLLRRMRGQANFAEYVPIALICMALLEAQHTPAAVLHGLGATLLVARLLHGYAFAFSANFPPGRFLGTLLTLLTLGAAGVLCVWKGVLA